MAKQLRAVLVEPPGQSGYLPIAVASLSASAMSDERLRSEVDFQLLLNTTSIPLPNAVSHVMRDGPPDVLALSCQGWAIPRADQIAAAVREASPRTLIIYGGNHVSSGGSDFFTGRPFADLLVNGEGELTFCDVLRAYAGSSSPDYGAIQGLSWKASPDHVVTTQERDRAADLDSLPSPYLTGCLDDFLDRCQTALLETNRGCPYKCSFCYWGQAVGGRVHTFGVDRVREEMKFLAGRGIDSWYICDANFGMQQRDQEVVDTLIELKKKYGVPRVLHTNWAKSSNERIVDICARLNASGIYCSFTLALQTTTPEALDLANRRNMKINKLREIGQLCRERKIVPRGDLIWGLPGESYSDFLDSFNELSEYTSLIGVYPHYLLPNTEYSRRRVELGLQTERPDPRTDYEYCVTHPRMPRADFDRGLRFIASNNILSLGSGFFRVYPRVARLAAGVSPAQAIGAFGDWILKTSNPVARRFLRCFQDPLRRLDASFMETWRLIRTNRDKFIGLVSQYVEESIHERQPDDVAKLLREAFRFDSVTYVKVLSGDGGEFVREVVSFDCDFLEFTYSDTPRITPGKFEYTIRWPVGLRDYSLENWYFGLPAFLPVVERVESRSRAAADVGLSRGARM
jgi:hypothetical protein